MMKRIYEVMKAMDTDPASFFKQVAKGEITLIIESVTGEQLKPSLEFWKQVIKTNSGAIPTLNANKLIGSFSTGSLTVDYETMLKMKVEHSDIDVFFTCLSKDLNTLESGKHNWALKVTDIYTDYQPAQANNAPADSVQADQPKPQTIQAKGKYAAKINQAIIDFEQSAEFIKHGKGTQQGLVGDWLESRGFAHRDEQRVIKVLISEHYGLTTSRKLK